MIYLQFPLSGDFVYKTLFMPFGQQFYIISLLYSPRIFIVCIFSLFYYCGPHMTFLNHSWGIYMILLTLCQRHLRVQVSPAYMVSSVLSYLSLFSVLKASYPAYMVWLSSVLRRKINDFSKPYRREIPVLTDTFDNVAKTTTPNGMGCLYVFTDGARFIYQKLNRT